MSSVCSCISTEKKIFISVQTGLLAFLIFNPVIFQAMRHLLGGWVANTEGLPSIYGLILHTVLFSVVVFLLMVKKPRRSV